MSRIEEALRRASGEKRGDHPGESSAPESRIRVLVESSLERYPQEEPIARPATVPRETLKVRDLSAARPVVAQTINPLDRIVEGKLVGVSEATTVSIEQYSRLAAALHEVQTERGLKSVMVTSAVPREGKSLTVANLAVTLSELYRRRVLVIDADLRRPAVHEIFKLSNKVGLTDHLHGRVATVPLLELSPRLSVVPAGRPDANPTAGLVSDRMKAVVDNLAPHFDWVIIDTPPIGLLTDANLLARLAEGVLLVIAAGSTPYPAVQRALAQIGPERVLGTVLNRVVEQTIPMTDYYHHYGGRAEALP